MRYNKTMKRQTLILFIIFMTIIFSCNETTNASLIDELKSKISKTANEVQKLEQEIKEYEGKVQETKKEATTLGSTIKELEYTEKKLQTDITVTEKRIENTELNIERLGIEIGATSEKIEVNKDTIRNTLLKLQEAESLSLIEIFFIHETISDFLGVVNNLEFLQKNITLQLGELQKNKIALLNASEEAQIYKSNLTGLQQEYIDKKQITKTTKEQKNELLEYTKSKQDEYETLLQDRIKRKKDFEEELNLYENELREVLDRSLLPTPRGGVLSWPLKNFVITQYYGNTPFATKNPSIYSGNGHNGIDLGVGIGTSLFSSREGKVLGFGDTDLTCPNSSYGKWILIEHDNGLSTLYAHLSLIRVSVGEIVKTGQLIGYTGNTGYSTGPHLHFTVFAGDSVKIGQLKSRSCLGAIYTIPLLTKTGGYLNPLSYLPEL